MNDLREALAAYAHRAWAFWMQYLFTKSKKNSDGTVTIPQHLAARWHRQLITLYADLSESEKESDRKQADKILRIIGK